jgi:hypothetical protein
MLNLMTVYKKRLDKVVVNIRAYTCRDRYMSAPSHGKSSESIYWMLLDPGKR